MGYESGHGGDRNWCSLIANDASEQAHNLRDWQQEYDQFSGGSFYGRIDEYAFANVRVFQEFTNQALIQQCNVWPQAIWFGLSVGDQKCKINGTDVNSNQLMLRPGNQQFELITPENYEIFGVVVKKDQLLKCADVQDVDLELILKTHTTAKWDPIRLHILRSMLTQLITPQKKSTLCEDDLLTMVLNALEHSDFSRKMVPSFHRRKSAVDRIRELAKEKTDRLLTVTELCREVNMSRRSLQYSFETVLGVSPQKYLKMTRLNQVRRQFKTGLDDYETIALIASQWGFNHAGQFAIDYKQLFRESPSQTLRFSD